MILTFSKYSGLGNDFLFIDNRENIYTLSKDQIQWLCHRTRGVGADGVVLLQNSTSCDYQMKIFNADGNEAEMCGNALRCLYFFIQKVSPSAQTSFLIETLERELNIQKMGDYVLCEMGEVTNIQLNVALQTSRGPVSGHFVNTGVPHFVIFTENLSQEDVAQMGAEISFHPFFQPARTNVNFVQKKEGPSLVIRTFERGVEAETEACGTGAAAAATVSALVDRVSSPVTVQVRSGETLEFQFQMCQNKILNLKMLGSAMHIFDGQIALLEPAFNK